MVFRDFEGAAAVQDYVVGVHVAVAACAVVAAHVAVVACAVVVVGGYVAVEAYVAVAACAAVVVAGYVAVEVYAAVAACAVVVVAVLWICMLLWGTGMLPGNRIWFCCRTLLGLYLLMNG